MTEQQHQQQPYTSLTAPWDRVHYARPVANVPALTPEEVEPAFEENYSASLTRLYPRVDRVYKDPTIPGQEYCMHSFVPALGARPDEKGVYGFVKCRGTFPNEQSAAERARFLIEKFDSAHQIFTSMTGEPFPVCAKSSVVAKAKEEDLVDIRKHAIQNISQDVRKKMEEEQKEVEEMKERERKLLEESRNNQEGKEVQAPIDVYITTHVKRANLTWTYFRLQKQLEELRPKIRRSYNELMLMELKDASLYRTYYQRYLEARQKAHVPLDDPNKDDNWMRYMCEDGVFDFDIPEIEERKQLLANTKVGKDDDANDPN